MPIRTPLNGIIGLAESLIDGATGKLPQNTCNNLTMIVSSGKRLANLVNDILDLSALKAGSLTIRPRPTDLAQTITEVVNLSAHLIGKKELKLLNNTDKLPHINIDKSRIVQVLHNVIGNAIKFTQKGSVTVTSAITGDWVKLMITGILYLISLTYTPVNSFSAQVLCMVYKH